MANSFLTAIGLMSGTSLDGVDAALIVTDGETVREFGPALTMPYPDDVRARLRQALDRASDADAADEIADTERDMTLFHADAVRRLLADHAGAVDLVGFHGQTILHRPENGVTRQIGDGALLARELGLPVINDFRSADVAAGGQGAPLVPLYHAALARGAGLDLPAALVNIGGVANVTWLGRDGVLAFDTGPGNALIDDWALRHAGARMDEDGRLAAAGQVHHHRVAAVMRSPYFSVVPPKSLDRNDFALAGMEGLSAADGAATLAEITAAAIAAARAHFPEPARSWHVTGGGRRNPVLMARLADLLGMPVAPVEQLSWRGDSLEAEAFAFLAVRSLYGLPLSVPGSTGVPAPQTGGRLHRPGQ